MVRKASGWVEEEGEGEHYKCGPWAIPVINMAGSFVLGALSVSSQVDPRVKLMVGVRFCGTLKGCSGGGE